MKTIITKGFVLNVAAVLDLPPLLHHNNFSFPSIHFHASFICWRNIIMFLFFQNYNINPTLGIFRERKSFRLQIFKRYFYQDRYWSSCNVIAPAKCVFCQGTEKKIYNRAVRKETNKEEVDINSDI